MIALSPIIIRYFRPLVEVWHNLLHFIVTCFEQIQFTLSCAENRVESQIIGTLSEDKFEPSYLLIELFKVCRRCDKRFIDNLRKITPEKLSKFLKMCIAFCTHRSQYST